MEKVIVVLGGSLDPNSKSEIMLTQAQQAIEACGSKAVMIPMSSLNLPFFSHQAKADNPQVDAFIEQVRQADGIIIASPEYHSGVSGVLKNALDFLTKDEVEHKAVGLMAVCGGASGGTSTLNGLATIMGALHAMVIPQQVIIGKSYQSVDEHNQIIDQDVVKRIAQVSQKVVQFSHWHRVYQAA